MRRMGFITFLLAFVLVFAGSGVQAAEKGKGSRTALPEIDRHAERPVRAPRELSAAEKKLVRPGKAIQYEERLGVPTFLWAAPSSAAEMKARAAGGAKPDVAGEARRHAAAYASFYGLEKGDFDRAKVVQVHDTGSGGVIVKFQEDIGGIEVFREELSVMMDRNLEPIAFSGYLSGAPRLIAARAASFQLDEREAAAIALSDRTGGSMTRAELVTTGARQGPYGFVDQDARMKRAGAATTGDSALTEPVRYKQVYFHTADAFEPAYYLEVSAELRDTQGGIDNDMYSYVVSANDGRILYRHNLTVSDSFTYRLWADESGSSVNVPSDSPHGDGTTPHPTGVPNGVMPPFIASSLHTLQAYPFSHAGTDPWLPSNATETVGNNVDAYVDRFGTDGYSPASGDFRAPLSSPNTFDYTYDPNADPLANVTQQRASITSLFYMDNFLHDFFYDAGFNEAAGTAQTDNYGRGGVAGDPLRAEAQDGSGTNNANMSTPADGGRPRQQMYLWNGPQNETITVNSQPGSGLPPSYGPFQIGTAAFGPQSFDVTSDVVRTIPFDACSAPISNGAALAGKIAFIDRGGVGGICATQGFSGKTASAAAAGAVGVIIANVSTSGNPTIAPNMAATNPPCPAQPASSLGGCTIGTLSLNVSDGEAWRTAIAAGTVNATLKRDANFRDGSLDAHVVSHEWGHYLSNRLINNASGLGNQMGGGMGEGWGDFTALMTTVREFDDTGSNANWNGAYPLVPYASVAFSPDGYYFGIRRVPYSTNMNIDPLTFRHISNGQSIVPPFGGPCDGCTDSSNMAEVHNTGEVWTTMLWECFAALLNNHPFQDARTRITNYVVAGLKMTPTNPTFTEARDAVLAAAFAADPADHTLFCAAFAKRGIGTTAVSPDRFSNTNTPVTESFVCENFMIFQGASLSAPTDSCDTDGYLDNTEHATLTVTYKNISGVTLTDTMANISSSNPNIFFSNGGVISFPDSAPFQTTTGTIDVSMVGATGTQDFYIDIAGDDPAITAPIPVSHLDVRGNADDVPNSSKSDSVEARITPWSSAGSTNGTWVRQQFLPSPPTLPPPPFSYDWHTPDQGDVSDIRLTSPVVHVGAGGTTFTFKHRYSFEATFDGGVVETSIDGGSTWVDIGADNLSPTYAAAPLVAGSPLQGRRAFTGNSGGYPALVTVTGTLGAAFANLDVRIRFRAASDGGVGGPGWDVDDIVFANITNTPFPTVVPQPANPAVEALAPAHAWIGLKNSDDVGTNFDLLAEVFRNGVLIGSGQVNNVSGGSSGFNNAKDRAITLALSSPGTSGACSGDTLSIKLSVRIGATGHRSGTARLWYNDSQANSRFGVTIAGVPSDLYLLDGFVLGTSPGAGPKKTIDVFVDRNGGNPWKPFGTWVKTF
jgi:large repetitive protein